MNLGSISAASMFLLPARYARYH